MRSSSPLVFAIALLATVSVGFGGSTEPKPAQFPPRGTPYVKARAMLLAQGLRIAPDKPSHSDAAFHEVDCWTVEQARLCRALYLERDSHGWRNYVVVEIDPKSKTVIRADYAMGADALASIPPPFAADIPHLKGNYFRARRQLQRLGYRPARRGQPARMCADDNCSREVELPEAECTGTGLNFCNTYWIAPNGRVLIVATIGERNPSVYYASWSTRAALRDFVRGR